MTRPAIMVLDDRPDSLNALDDALRRRYEPDYMIISLASAGAALNRLEQLQQAGRPVAIALAAATMADAAWADYLIRAHAIQPAAKRVLVVPRGGPAAPSLRVPARLLQDRSAALPVLRAMALGSIDTYLPAPVSERDEGFYRAVGELLDEWAHEVVPALPAVRIIGAEQSARAHELRDLLARNSIPFEFHTADSGPGRALLNRAGQSGTHLPVLVMYTGEVLVDPATDRLAASFGLAALPAEIVDVAIIGAGPAGLSAAVYAGSEGMSTLLLEREAIGGQAGSSSLIRNYLGFPRGVTGAALATRAFEQAWSFGAVPAVTAPVTGIRADSPGYAVTLADGAEARARSLLIATGVAYRRLQAPGLAPLIGAGVFYGAAASEATAMAGQRVFVAGGANSAGQAAINLARHAAQVTILVRRDCIADRMSQYLVDEINGAPNIDVCPNTEVTGGEGQARLEALILKNNKTGVTRKVQTAALFVLIGAEPRTAWLPGEIIRDDRGFVVTGSGLAPDGAPHGWPLQRPPLPLETSMPGVFAAGDVRQRSVKRVASAVGEGSVAATQLTQYLQESARS